MIVAARYKGSIRWYESEPDFWILDQNRWAQSFRDAGHDVPDDGYSDRFGIAVLDSDSAPAFFGGMAEFSVTEQDLHRRFRLAAEKANDWYDIADHLPSLLVDFDKHSLWSIHPELMSFVDFVPDGWSAAYASFFEYVPECSRFWIVDGTDVLRRFIEQPV